MLPSSVFRIIPSSHGTPNDIYLYKMLCNLWATRHGWMDGIPASYLGGYGFDFRPGCRLSQLEFFVSYTFSPVEYFAGTLRRRLHSSTFFRIHNPQSFSNGTSCNVWLASVMKLNVRPYPHHPPFRISTLGFSVRAWVVQMFGCWLRAQFVHLAWNMNNYRSCYLLKNRRYSTA
jgi:hypothetical protein